MRLVRGRYGGLRESAGGRPRPGRATRSPRLRGRAPRGPRPPGRTTPRPRRRPAKVSTWTRRSSLSSPPIWASSMRLQTSARRTRARIRSTPRPCRCRDAGTLSTTARHGASSPFRGNLHRGSGPPSNGGRCPVLHVVPCSYGSAAPRMRVERSVLRRMASPWSDIDERNLERIWRNRAP